MCKKLVLAAFLMILNVCSIADEYRCGWLENPTPDNWWLHDKDGSWAIAAEGGYSVAKRSLDNLPAIKDNEFVRTNGYYGYSCSCLSVSTDNKTKRILSILRKGKQMLLKKCLEDKRIAPPPKDNTIVHRSTPIELDHSPVSPNLPVGSSTSGSYMIQIFSTSNIEKAKKIKRSLNQSAFPTSITRTQIKGKNLYRVRIGSYPEKAMAVFYQAKLKRLLRENQGVQTSIIVRGST